jgi:hypothetical protein
MIFKGNFDREYVIDIDHNALFRWKSLKDVGTEYSASLSSAGKVTINTFIIKVPIIEYDSEHKNRLIADLINNDNYFFEFKQWLCIKHTDLSGNSLEVLNVSLVVRKQTARL